MKDLNLITPINQLGYGIAGTNIAKHLAQKCNLSLFPIKPIQVTTQEDADVVKRCIMNSANFNKEAPCLKIWHQHDMAEFVGKDKHIGFPFFELDSFNQPEKHHLNSLDELFVASQWAKNICEDQLDLSPEFIHVIPLGVDLSTFQCPNYVLENNENTVFFNCGKWEVRKGHDILYKVFSDTFSKEDKVELWMMCDNPFLTEEQTKEWHDLYKNSKLGDKIRFIPRVNTTQEVYNIMCKTDCGVFPSRAEGWNLEILELMACGKNIITTNFSAHTQFCDNENSMLINIDKTEKAFDGIWFQGQGSWAEIGDKQKEQLSAHMKEFHNRKQAGKAQCNTSGLITAQTHNWDVISERILSHV
jgi:glycosyltransferase involved in cell wall biosynthesis